MYAIVCIGLSVAAQRVHFVDDDGYAGGAARLRRAGRARTVAEMVKTAARCEPVSAYGLQRRHPGLLPAKVAVRCVIAA